MKPLSKCNACNCYNSPLVTILRMKDTKAMVHNLIMADLLVHSIQISHFR